jgi:hypothetical protein
MPRMQQQSRKMASEKPGSACNKDTHRMILLVLLSTGECHEIYRILGGNAGRSYGFTD